MGNQKYKVARAKRIEAVETVLANNGINVRRHVGHASRKIATEIVDALAYLDACVYLLEDEE